MKIYLIIFLLFFSNISLSRSIGETEITSEEGIEVFQNEKYYLLKKNVKIESDTFTLYGDKVTIIDAKGKVKLDAPEYKMKANGNSLIFEVKSENIFIEGIKSKLITENTNMFSDGEIKVNNISGEFLINGPNSSLKSQEIFIEGEYIDGKFSTNDEVKDIVLLNVNDEKIAYIKTEDTEMYSNNVKYNKQTSLIELEDNVKIIRDGETITGDYGTLDTKTNSYKVKSKNSNKVKVIIVNQNE